MLNDTHDPALTSWVASANQAGCDFTIQNLPHGVFRRRGSNEVFRGGVAIGECILDLHALCKTGVLQGSVADVLQAASAAALNGLMALGPSAWSELRSALSRLLSSGAAEEPTLRDCLVAQAEAEFAVPAQIGDFTDFLTSQYHSLNAGRVFNPDNALLPHFKWLPIAYHGRSSTVEVSGGAFPRPMGQTCAPGAKTPVFGPSRRMDYELELGIYIGPGNRQGEAIAIDAAEDHVFGLCLLNDWSARDLQAWEMFPLGPFLAKNFMTTVSPWIVTLEALAPYRMAPPREAGDPPTLPYLTPGAAHANGALDIQLEAWLQTAAQPAPQRLNRTSYRHAYWTPAQLVAHHASNGCRLRPGDLLGTGTQSGPTAGEEGCLLELSLGGKRPVALTGGEMRSYVEDGDTVILRGWCEAPGRARVGFGECRSTLLPCMTTDQPACPPLP